MQRAPVPSARDPLLARSRYVKDLYIACYADVNGWGGGVTAAKGLQAAAHSLGMSTLLLGAARRQDSTVSSPADADKLNVRLERPVLLWRLHSWTASGRLRRRLGSLLPPRVAFIGISPHWVVAAKHAWPQTRVVYCLPCLLANCLPFTWPRQRPPTLWTRLDFAGIRRVERRALALADLTLVPTQQAFEEVCGFYPPARHRLLVCHYGCRPQGDNHEQSHPTYGATGPAAAGATLVSLAAGVCDRNKAFHWAIRELAGVEGNPHLIIVGDGPEQPRLTRLARERGLSGRVHLVGAQRDMAAWYAAADVVVSTSRYDTFPNVILEGMAHGKAVLVPDHDPPRVYSGMAEVVRQYGGGLLYDRMRVGSLAQQWNHLSRNPHVREALGRQARSVAERLFRWDIVLDCMLEGTQVAGFHRSGFQVSAVADSAYPASRFGTERSELGTQSMESVELTAWT